MILLSNLEYRNDQYIQKGLKKTLLIKSTPDFHLRMLGLQIHDITSEEDECKKNKALELTIG